jgi:hypothetical protein
MDELNEVFYFYASHDEEGHVEYAAPEVNEDDLVELNGEEF